MGITENNLPGFIATPEPRKYLSDNYVVLDFEVEVNDERFGSALDSRNSLYLSCYTDHSARANSFFGDEFHQQRLIKAINAADFIVAHNSKYELGWLQRMGVDIGSLLVFDTKIAEYTLLGNLAAGDSKSGVRAVGTSLDECCIRRGFPPKDPVVDIWMKNGVKVSAMPQKWVQDRCTQDVLTTRDLFLDQRRHLLRTNRLGIVYTRCLFTPVLTSIESEGMHLDKERVLAEHTETLKRYRVFESELHGLTGGINWRSTKQVAAYLYDTLRFPEPHGRDGKPKRSATGKRTVSKTVLATLRPDTEDQRNFISVKQAISKVGSALSKSLNYFKDVVNERSNATFFAEFNQCVTATGRLSSTGIKIGDSSAPQFQNLPRDYKKLFSAKRVGWLVGEVDSTNAEFRSAAVLGSDSAAKRDISDPDWDAHLTSAAAMVEKAYGELRRLYLAGDKKTAGLRQEAKTQTFKPLYGGTKGTKAQERWYAEFKKRYPELAQAQADWVHEVLLQKRLITAWGLRFYWPHAKLSATGYCNNGHAIYNYPIQAFATAEVVPISVIYFWHTVRAAGLVDFIRPINTVHDSIVAEIHPDYVDQFKEIASRSFGPMVSDYLWTVYGMDFDVPLGCTIKIGKFWGEGEEERFEFINPKRRQMNE